MFKFTPRFVVKEADTGTSKEDETEEEAPTTVSDDDKQGVDAQTAETGTDTHDDEKTYTQAELNAIIARRLAKAKTSEEHHLDEKDLEKAREQGRLDAQRDILAQKYGLSTEFIPATTEKDLERFESELKATLQSSSRVQVIKTSDKPQFPAGIAGVRV